MATKKKSTPKKKPSALHTQSMGRALRPSLNKRDAEKADREAKEQLRAHEEATALSLAKKLLSLDAGEYKFVVGTPNFFASKSFSLLDGDKLSNCDKAARKQPHFTLLAQDNLTPDIVQEWIDLAEQNGVPHEKVKDAREVLKNIQDWRTRNPLRIKLPS